MYDELQLDTLGDKKTALFLIMSDTDSTFNFLISMVYTQLFNLLCDKADDVYGGKLPIHVRCLIDECANIGQIRLTGTTRSIVKSGGMNGKSSRTAIWKPMTARSVWTCVPMPDRGLILSPLSMRGLLSGRWKSVVSRRISAT